MKMLLFALFFPSLLCAEISSSSISSHKAFYDGNTLVLDGAVKLDHALGRLQSNTARLFREIDSTSFTSIHLDDDVFISLKNRGEIFCASADFDFSALRGKLLPKPHDMVRFVNLHIGPLSLASKKADIEFSREDAMLKVAKIEAHDTVQVQYGEDFFFTAESATYSNTKTPYIWASPDCVLTHYDDRIQAERIEVLPTSSKLIFTTPTGSLTPSVFSENDSVQFSCNKLIWEKAPQILILKGNIFLQDTGIGEITCEDEVELRQKEQEGKWILSSIVAKGKTQLKYDGDITHLLICYGQMQLDQDSLVLTVESPPEEPLEYFHNQMRLSADHAELKYERENHSITPEKLVLCGNIQLTSTEDALRCAVADQFVYFPEEKKMVLSAQRGNHVLFWDQEQELSISAKEVHVTHTENKETIKGVGNVRFAFSSMENELLKKIFPFYTQKRSPS